jgi:hypothetical protein
VTPLAIDLDALGDTKPLWNAWLGSVRDVLAIDPDALPADRGAAAAVLDESGAGNWRSLLERFSEDHAGAYLRRDAATSAALRSLSESSVGIGEFTDAPEEHAQVALAQFGASRRVSAVESGAGSLDRLRETLGADASVVRTRDDLLSRA